MTRTTLVTGGANGIGLAIARAFAKRGWRQLLVDINPSVHDAARELSTADAPVHGHVADLSIEDETVGSASRATQLFGGCDVLINCAGLSRKRNGESIPPHETSTADWDHVLRLNLTTPFVLSRELLPGMKERRFGRIVNITSRAGRTFVGVAGVDYAASKAGLIGLTRHLAGTYAPFGITVNAVAPGRVVTALSSKSSPEVIARSIQGIPVGRLGDVDEVAAAVDYLCSDAAAYTTGVCLDVNGGAFIA